MAEQTGASAKKTNGGTLFDYAAWRGDLTFEHSPFNEIDSVIAAMISYANLGENELVFESGRTLALSSLADSDLLERLPQEGIGDGVRVRNRFLNDLARSPRFQEITVLDQVNDVDEARDIQFSAMTLRVPFVGTVVAFRGTDPSLVGWKEDFMMSYVTPVPAQSAALDYLKKAAEHTEGPLYLTGHSKGGNLALYAAAHAPSDLQARILQIDSFDGPGLDDETIASEGYKRIEGRIRSFVPSDSIVGMLMNYYPGYQVVQADSFSLLQHDPFTWRLLGTHFLAADKVSSHSQILDQTIHEWLKSCTPEQRETFVTVIFSLLAKKQASGGDTEQDGLLKKADNDSKRMIRMLINRLIGIHAGIAWNTNVLKPLVQASDDLRVRFKERQGNLFKSGVIPIDNHGKGFREAADETMRLGEKTGLGREDCLRLALITEEILSMASIVTGELKASFWIEALGGSYELYVSTPALLDRRRKLRIRKMTDANPSGKQGGFLSRLSSAFERARAGDSDEVCFALPSPREREEDGQWDGYERSILYRLADDVQILLVGGEVRMIVRREFPALRG